MQNYQTKVAEIEWYNAKMVYKFWISAIFFRLSREEHFANFL
jgi:hypothetical protein